MSAAGDRVPEGHLSEIFASLQGEGDFAGQHHLFVRFAGCHLRCVYCDTPESLVRVPECRVDYPSGEREVRRNPISAGELAGIVARFVSEEPRISMISITGGEPMLQHRFITSWLAEFKERPPAMLETSASKSDGLSRMLPHLAAVSADIKLPSNSGERALWDEHRQFFELCARSLSVQTYVKVPIDDTTRDDELRRAAKLVAELLPDSRLHLQPVADPDNRWRLGSSRMAVLFAVAASEHARSGFRPQMHKLLNIP